MHKRHLILLTFLLLVGGWRAQAQNITAAGSSCATAGACAVIQLSTTNTGSVTFTISGTFSATLQFEELADGTEANKSAVNCVPPNSTTAVTSTTAAGTWTCNVPGAQVFRVRCSAYTSGTAVVALNASNAIDTALLGSGGGGGSGTVTSVTFTGDGTVLSATPSSAVTTSGTLTAALATQTANTVLGALTATTPSDLALPSCSAAASALIYTLGTGFGCHIPSNIPIANVGSAGLTGTSPIAISSGGAISCSTCNTSSANVNSVSGDGYLTSNSASTGAVTLAQPNHTANTVAGALTATALSDLALPSCSASTSALTWTSGTGFGCHTISGGSGTVTSVTFTGDGTILSSTPSSAVTTSGTVTATLANQTANTVLGALTATTPSDLAMPSCSAAGSALKWTSGTGFGCNTVASSAMLMSGTTSTVTPSGTQYMALGLSSSSLNATQAVLSIPMPRAGTFTAMYVRLSVAEGAAATLQFTLQDITASLSAITCTVGNSATTCNDTGHTIAFSAGDTVVIQTIQTGTGSAQFPFVAVAYQ